MLSGAYVALVEKGTEVTRKFTVLGSNVGRTLTPEYWNKMRIFCLISGSASLSGVSWKYTVQCFRASYHFCFQICKENPFSCSCAVGGVSFKLSKMCSLLFNLLIRVSLRKDSFGCSNCFKCSGYSSEILYFLATESFKTHGEPCLVDLVKLIFKNALTYHLVNEFLSLEICERELMVTSSLLCNKTR